MDLDNRTATEIESELFALVNSIIKLYNKYNEGRLTFNFFIKALKNAMRGLTKINLFYNEKGIAIPDLLIKMKLTKEYNTAMNILKEFSNLNSTNEFITSHNNNFLKIENNTSPHLIFELPKITSEITSSFITLMDALKLEGIKNSVFIIKLFDDLKKNIKKFPGLEEVQFKINQIFQKVSRNPNNLVENKKFREIVVDKLYQIFLEFQQKLI
ncbi:MAG: hypothetical protein ACFFAO_20725 [Candidatus Hermodarchaeota archaeon]